ncbi:thiamine-phosphate kinase [Frankia sp. EI5c]|uniref:thiamine-phosphate kinase n=1 Tax=Frankia sp. EI5c TaxID=683316 RepID=UPI0007C244A3|nr:thiamine-phosphate kinase [Frankia sp. EI5c]OAA24972.1 thiamine-phosphate kinase [Frankia sp. EI5c]
MTTRGSATGAADSGPGDSADSGTGDSADSGTGDTVADLGEFGLIRAITRRLPTSPDILLGPGDDAAVVAAADGRVVVTTDLLIEGRHFRRDWSSAYDVGRKAAAQNLADVAAMGARPTALVVGLGAPGTLPVTWAEQLADGLRDECALVGASVAGGDVSSSESVVLAITALGDLAGRPPVRRDTARPGDLVVLAGRIGWAEAGLGLLRAAAAGSPVRLDTPGHAELVLAHQRPRPPYRHGPLLAAAGAHAMCDISDGLLADLGHIAAASGVWIDLDSDLVPVPAPIRAAAAAVGTDPLGWILHGGDDHALVACLAPGTEPPADCALIGRVLDPADHGSGAGGSGAGGGGVLVDGHRPAGPTGWDHFRADGAGRRGNGPPKK